MTDAEYMRERLEDWVRFGDLSEDLDLDQAVNVLIGAYERSTAHVSLKLPVQMWCDTFYKVMMDSPQQLRFSYLRGARAKAARH